MYRSNLDLYIYTISYILYRVQAITVRRRKYFPVYTVCKVILHSNPSFTPYCYFHARILDRYHSSRLTVGFYMGGLDREGGGRPTRISTWALPFWNNYYLSRSSQAFDSEPEFHGESIFRRQIDASWETAVLRTAERRRDAEAAAPPPRALLGYFPLFFSLFLMLVFRCSEFRGVSQVGLLCYVCESLCLEL